MNADYVVVGGGSAGCVLAARLSEDPDATVLLLEAGPADDLPEIGIPARLGLLFKTEVDWDFHSEPEPRLDRRRNYLPRGRMLGGSGSLNGMVYIRGHRADYDEWRDMGLDGWGYDDVLPYFKRSEDNERGADEFHGAGGPLAVSGQPIRAAARRRLRRGGRAGRARAQRGLQRARPGGRGPLPGDPARRPALQLRARLPGTGARAAEPDRAHGRARHARPVRGRPRRPESS